MSPPVFPDNEELAPINHRLSATAIDADDDVFRMQLGHELVDSAATQTRPTGLRVRQTKPAEPVRSYLAVAAQVPEKKIERPAIGNSSKELLYATDRCFPVKQQCMSRPPESRHEYKQTNKCLI